MYKRNTTRNSKKTSQRHISFFLVMTTSFGYYTAHINCKSQERMSSHPVQRVTTERVERKVESTDAVQGRVFWLPSREKLPARAVRRAHGKGAVEGGIYGHPVVVVSRPAEERDSIHFHLITSLQGKRLEQLYNKSNEFHASRRSWFLPISPTADHPDAISKKTKKRFPTLELADGAMLRWRSYVNIRHVYKIEWSHLKMYANQETPTWQQYRLKEDSMTRLLAKGKILTMYEPGPQLKSRVIIRSASEPILSTYDKDLSDEPRSSVSDTESMASVVCRRASDLLQSDFQSQNIEDHRRSDPPRPVPPDPEEKYPKTGFFRSALTKSFDEMLKWMAAEIEGRSAAKSSDRRGMRRPIDQFWINLKGVIAVFIASMC